MTNINLKRVFAFAVTVISGYGVSMHCVLSVSAMAEQLNMPSPLRRPLCGEGAATLPS